MRMLVDDDESYPSPNHVNVKKALNWLCQDREDGDIIFMHFSGHGTQVPADDDDVESDNLDEAIVLEELFLMADDDLKQFFSQLPSGAIVTVVTDCCHSGTMLDGTEVAIEGPKDGDYSVATEESDELLETLGGSRAYEVSASRSLPIETVCSVMSQKLGSDVPPTGSGVNGAMAKIFGGTAGKLMFKYAMSRMSKSEGDGGNMMGLVTNLLGSMGGSNRTSSQSGAGDMISSLLGGGGGSGGYRSNRGDGGGGMSGMISSFLGGGGESEAPPPSQESSQDPLSTVMGLMGKFGLSGMDESVTETVPYNPNHEALPSDICVLITGCQADETSADVRPPGGDAYGALTKTLTDIQAKDSNVSYHDLVSKVRESLSASGFSQNPCLETSSEKARLPFICES